MTHTVDVVIVTESWLKRKFAKPKCLGLILHLSEQTSVLMVGVFICIKIHIACAEV